MERFRNFVKSHRIISMVITIGLIVLFNYLLIHLFLAMFFAGSGYDYMIFPDYFTPGEYALSVLYMLFAYFITTSIFDFRKYLCSGALSKAELTAKVYELEYQLQLLQSDIDNGE